MANNTNIRCPYCGSEMTERAFFFPARDGGNRTVTVHYACMNCNAVSQPSGKHTRIKDAETEAKSFAMQIEQVKIPTHSDKEILDACISLIDGVLNGEYGIYQQLADDGFDFDGFEERFGCKLGFSYSYFELVQQLFLWGTYHSGGTSTRAKCRELGVDAGEAVDFSRRLEGEEE